MNTLCRLGLGIALTVGATAVAQAGLPDEGEWFDVASDVSETAAARLRDWKMRQTQAQVPHAALLTVKELEQTEMFKLAVELLGTIKVRGRTKLEKLWSLDDEGALVRVDGLEAITGAGGRAVNWSGDFFAHAVYLTPWGLREGWTQPRFNNRIFELLLLSDDDLQVLDKSKQIAAPSIKTAVKKVIEKFGKKQ